MKFGSIVFLLLVFLIDRMFQKKLPELYRKLQLPVNVMLSLLVTVYCGLSVYAVYDVLTSGVSLDSKIFFTIFIGIIVSVYAAMVIVTWKRWAKEK